MNTNFHMCLYVTGLTLDILLLKSATIKKTPTQNMKGREDKDNTDDRKRHTDRHLKMTLKSAFNISPGFAYTVV